jgi:RND family efflux transporter MFP subunit
MKEEIENALAEAESHLAAAAAQKELAASTFQRINNLYRKQSSSRQEFEEAQSRKDAAEAQWNAARQRVAQAKAKLQQLKSENQELSANLSYVRITAPFDGIVVSVSADEGTFVNPGQVLATIERLETYQIIFMAEQELLPLLKEGQSLQVEIGGTDRPAEAIVSEINTSMDPATRTFLVKADLSQFDKPIKSGISATALLQLPARSSLWIPEEFLNSVSGLETVTVRRDDRWERTLVRSGKHQDGKVEIVSGLNAGEEIAVLEE